MITEFLHILFPPGTVQGYLTIWTLPDRMAYYLPIHDLGAIAAKAAELDAQGKDVYFGLSLRRQNLMAFAQPGEAPRGKKIDCSAIPGFWIEIDFGTAGHKASNCPPDLQSCIEILAHIPFIPAVLNHSGGGLHAYYLFDYPFSFPPLVGVAQLESLIRRLQSLAVNAAKARGWHVDFTADITRVLRLPGTRNHKIPSQPRPVVTLALDPAARYSLAQFETALSAVPVPVIDSPPIAGTGIAVPPPPPFTGDPAALREDIRDRLGKLRKPETRIMAKAILKGESFANPGERDDKLNRAASMIAALAPDAPPDILAEILRPSLSVWAAEPGATLTVDQEMRKAEDKITRSQADLRLKNAAVTAQAQSIKAGLIRAARRVSEKSEPAATPTDPADPDAAADPNPPGEYTDSEIAGFATQQNCTVDEFRKRWIIQRGDEFHIYCAGDYLPGIRRTELAVSLPRDLAPAPIDWMTYKANGDPRPKSIEELLTDYATVARGHVADMTLNQSAYDPVTQIYHQSVCRRRPITPTFHPTIDRWLRLLGGLEAEKLLDWLACSMHLDRQICAAYVNGPPGIGKGLLALGLSRLWTTGGPAELKRVIDSFNGDLLRCPLVVADEKLPTKANGNKLSSADIRELVGSSKRTLSRKFLDNADLIGSLRLLLTENSGRMLSFDEDLGALDLAAVSSRILHIESPQAAADYLAQIGGYQTTVAWIDQDQIAQHVSWLAENRKVIPGGRFIVEGHTSKMLRNLAVSGKWTGLVCEWLTRYMARPVPNLAQLDLVRIGNGRILINSNAVVQFWTQYIQSEPQPSTPRIGRALTNISRSDDQIRINDIRYKDINPDLVLQWAEENQIGNPDAMRSWIAAPLADKPVQASQPVTSANAGGRTQ